MLIDTEKVSSYPEAMRKAVCQYIRANLHAVEKEIQTKTIEKDFDVRCAIENYLRECKAELLYRELSKIMSDCTIVCYHATKVLCRAQIMENGLRVNECEEYSKAMREVLMALGASNIEESMGYIRKEYERKYVKPQLCFFSGVQLINGLEFPGYDQFCENIGGELARWALREKQPETYKMLRNNGIPFIVKFGLRFRDIANYQQDSILYQFVSYYAAQYFWNWNYSIKFDGITYKNVAPQQILEMIDYGKKVNCE
ncbi:hypothetical protein B5E53_17015 [Eubacterium sp. An11]|uniref:hypothetical protein n=1 Tax=Eubacterium sp. An11 TaxID=1965542 RepID=UPI000B371A19|nr:hypothetical protein [Eubacterium sp. An11]OUQ62831.1 hypothetical protein B5E53_17015 [Eubacterium sp. An11]